MQLLFLTFFSQFAVLDLGGVLATGSVPAVAGAFLVLFLLDDFCCYWFPRVHHRIQVLLGRPRDPPFLAVLQPLDGLRAILDAPLDLVDLAVPVMLVGFTPRSGHTSLDQPAVPVLDPRQADRPHAGLVSEFVFNTQAIPSPRTP